VTTTSTYTTTSFISTYSAIQYYTTTFSILPQPTNTLTPSADPTEIFRVYDDLDFISQDSQTSFATLEGPLLLLHTLSAQISRAALMLVHSIMLMS
jgi:hypothetical protein